MKKQYFYTLEKDTYKFFEQQDYDIQLVEFENNIIKYRFKDLFIPDSAKELKKWEYEKMINQFIFKK